MYKFIRQITCYALLILALANISAVRAQDRITINREIKFRSGRISATQRGRISRGTSHIYRVRARGAANDGCTKDRQQNFVHHFCPQRGYFRRRGRCAADARGTA